MTKEERDAQSRDQLLYTMLCALIKQNNGEIRIAESDLDSVTRYDNIMIYHDKKNQEVILTNHLVDNSNPDEVH